MLARTVVSGTSVVAIRYGGAVTMDEMLDARGAGRGGRPVRCCAAAHRVRPYRPRTGRAKAMWGGPDYSP